MPETLEIRSAIEFQNKKPLCIILYAGDAINDEIPPCEKEKYSRVLREITELKLKYDFVEINGKHPPNFIPEDLERPILVCGFHGENCVKEQAGLLKRLGYDVSISKEGTYFFNEPVLSLYEKLMLPSLS